MPGEEQKQLEFFIKQHLALINKAAFFYSNNSEERQDLVQEIVYQVIRAYPSFRGDSKSTTWVYKIAINTCISTIRKKKIEVLPLKEEHAELHAEPSHAGNERLRQLKLAINMLNEGEKPLVMLYLEDLPYKEIGSILGITENAVAIKMHRIKEKLKKIML